MKFFLKLIFKYLAKIVSIFYNNETSVVLKNYKNVLYSYWLKNSIKTCGKEFRVQSPSYIKGGEYITISEGFFSLERLRLECWDNYINDKFTPILIIGNNVVMNFNVHIGCINSVSIGNNVLMGSNILITDHQHGFVDYRDIDIVPKKRPLTSIGPVIIQDNVWIGDNVAVMPNVTIGIGCIIGANSVVTKSFPEYSVLAGSPARLIKTLTSNKQHEQGR